MRLGENPKNAISSMWKKHQNLLSNNNDAPGITKYGSLVRPHTQIVALRLHCAKCAALGETARRWLPPGGSHPPHPPFMSLSI